MENSFRIHQLMVRAPKSARSPDDPDFVGWKRDCEATIKRIYGAESSEFADFRILRFEWRGVATAMHGPGAPKLFQDSIDRAVALLRSFHTEQVEEEGAAALRTSPEEQKGRGEDDKRKVFVVHGHDEALKEQVARLLSKLQLEPVILHEAADQALTIIEKLEMNSKVGFAVVLMTGDDEGRKCGGDPLNRRARQNVVFECGYFVGMLGRARVLALMEEGLEKFSDYDGVLVTKIDSAGAWRTKLAQELRAAGYAVDMNLL